MCYGMKAAVLDHAKQKKQEQYVNNVNMKRASDPLYNHYILENHQNTPIISAMRSMVSKRGARDN